MTERGQAPDEVVERLRSICLALPEAYEEVAWVGVRWMVRKRTFAHVVVVADGWPPVYAKAVGSEGSTVVLTFESSGTELDVLRSAGPPFIAAPWRPTIVGLALDGTISGDGPVDWDEVAELLTESYCVQAPASLAGLVDRPPL